MIYASTTPTNAPAFSVAPPIPIQRKGRKGAVRLGALVALGVALVALVVALSSGQNGSSVAPDDVAAILFQQG